MVDWGGDDNYSAEWQKALEKVDFQAGQLTALRQEVAALTTRIAELEAENHDLSVAVEGGVIAAHALRQEVASARRAAIEACEREIAIARREWDDDEWPEEDILDRLAGRIAKLKDTP